MCLCYDSRLSEGGSEFTCCRFKLKILLANAQNFRVSKLDPQKCNLAYEMVYFTLGHLNSIFCSI